MHSHAPFQQNNPIMRGWTGTSSKRLGCTLSSLFTNHSHCTISHHPWLTCCCAAAVADDAGQQHVLTLDAAGWAALWQQQEGLGLTCLLFDRVAPLEPGTHAMLTHMVRAGVGGAPAGITQPQVQLHMQKQMQILLIQPELSTAQLRWSSRSMRLHTWH
jgi:hypothetical protein